MSTFFDPDRDFRNGILTGAGQAPGVTPATGGFGTQRNYSPMSRAGSAPQFALDNSSTSPSFTGSATGFPSLSMSLPYPSGAPRTRAATAGLPLSLRGQGAPMFPGSSPTPSSPVPFLGDSSTRTVGAPMIGGNRAIDQGVTGAMKQRVAGQIRDDVANGNVAAPNPIGSAMSEQNLRQMWKSVKDSYPTAGRDYWEQEFHNRAASKGIDGQRWLADVSAAEGGEPKTQFMQTPGGATVASTPYSMLGTDKSGGTPPPGMPSGAVYNATVSAPTFGTAPGFTPIASKYLLSQGSPSNTMPMRTIDDAKRGRSMEADRLEIVGNAQQQNAPVTDRERFKGAVDVAGKQAEALAGGRDVYHINEGNAPGKNGTPAADKAARVQFFRSLSTERVNDESNPGKTRKMTVAEKMALTDKFFGGGQSADTAPSTFSGGNDAAPVNRQNAAPSTQPSGVPHQLGNGRTAYLQPNGQWLDEQGREIQ